jgi:hypothetical protein
MIIILRRGGVVPPDLMAPTARSPILRKLIRPEGLWLPPARHSPSPRRREKFLPVPEPYFEQARLAHPQVHDPAVVDEIVGDRLMKQTCGCGCS